MMPAPGDRKEKSILIFFLWSAVALAAVGCRDVTDAQGETAARRGEMPRRLDQPLKIGDCRWGKVVINGRTFEEDVVISKNAVRERNKKPSKKYAARFGHTPLSVDEEIPWDCEELVVGIGFQSSLPVMNEVKAEALKRNVKFVILPTRDAVAYFKRHQEGRNAVFHLTC